MTISEFKIMYRKNNTEGHFFDIKTLRFFGDTMKNFGLFKSQNNFILYRKKPVAHGLSGGFMFDKNGVYIKKLDDIEVRNFRLGIK